MYAGVHAGESMLKWFLVLLVLLFQGDQLESSKAANLTSCATVIKCVLASFAWQVRVERCTWTVNQGDSLDVIAARFRTNWMQVLYL